MKLHIRHFSFLSVESERGFTTFHHHDPAGRLVSGASLNVVHDSAWMTRQLACSAWRWRRAVLERPDREQVQQFLALVHPQLVDFAQESLARPRSRRYPSPRSSIGGGAGPVLSFDDLPDVRRCTESAGRRIPKCSSRSRDAVAYDSRRTIRFSKQLSCSHSPAASRSQER